MCTIVDILKSLEKNSLVDNEWLKQFANEDGECIVPVSGYATEGDIIIAIHTLIQEIEQLKGGWISVNDSLPPPYTSVLFTDKQSTYLLIGEFHKTEKNGYWTDTNAAYHEWGEIDFWHALPEPPKKERNEE